MLLCMALSSCFKDEPLNTECDIEEAYIHAADPAAMFFQPSDSLIDVLSSENTVTFNVRKETDLTALAPQFRITPGATVVPESGSVHDFSAGPVVYTVTSEDGEWHRDYLVSVAIKTRIVNEEETFSFEHYALEASQSKYYVWTEDEADGHNLDMWCTGNPGFKLSKGSARPAEYPTTPTDDGYEGHGVKLTTCDTGLFGKLAKKPIAAGNLFIGRFDVDQAMKDAMKATMFGQPVAQKPVRFSGWYKYQAGTTVTDMNKNVVSGAVDRGNIYAVFYKNTDAEGNAIVLQGDNVKTSSQVVAIADLGLISDTPEWTHFDIEFTFQQDVDPTLLENYGYSAAIVCTSSNEGATFQGAVGSTLIIDELKLTWETIE